MQKPLSFPTKSSKEELTKLIKISKKQNKITQSKDDLEEINRRDEKNGLYPNKIDIAN